MNRGLLLSCFTFLSGCFFLTDFEGLQGDGGAGPTGGSPTDGGGGSTTNTGAGPVGGDGGGGATTSQGGDTSGGGGAGGSEPCPPPGVNYSGLTLNELAPSGLPADWMELHNASADPIPLCGVFITQKYDGASPPSGGDRFTFGQVTIGAGAYLVIEQGTAPGYFPYGLSKDEEERISLFAPDGTVLADTTYIPESDFFATDSWARIPDVTGPFRRVPSATRGAENVDTSDVGGGGGGVGGSPDPTGGGGTGGI